MNSKKDGEEGTNSNDNTNNNNGSNENSDNFKFDKGKDDDEKKNSRFQEHSSTRSPSENDKSIRSLPSKDSNDLKHRINSDIKGIKKKIKMYKVGSINKKILYSAIGIVIVAVVIMIFSQGSSFKFNQDAVIEAKDLEISLKNISIANINNDNIKINTIFDVYNPNRGTLILENIHYNVNLENTRIASGDIGERPEGFIDSSAGIYPIIGNGTVTLKDEKIIQKNNRIDNLWNNITDERSTFHVNGNFAFRQTSSFQAHGGEIDFNLIYP